MVNNNKLDKTIFKILKYYYIDDLSQVEISKKLNITRVSVSRYLTKAKKLGLIEHRIKYPKDFLFNRNEKLEKEIRDKYDLKECVIVSSQYSRKERMLELAGELEKFLQNIVKDHTHIGVGYGVTLDSIVEYINIKVNKDIKVVPLVGCYSNMYDNRHSNNIANILAQKFNGISYSISTPARVDTKEIKKTLEKDSSFIEISNLINRVEVAIICMSDLSKESTLYRAGQLSEEDLYYLEGKGIIGDINYNFVDKNGKFVENDISERQIILLPLEKMKNIKNAIGLVMGARKAEILKTVLDGNYINSLFCDEDALNILA
jgi:deoxyribonucleoside regulator